MDVDRFARLLAFKKHFLDRSDAPPVPGRFLKGQYEGSVIYDDLDFSNPSNCFDDVKNAYHTNVQGFDTPICLNTNNVTFVEQSSLSALQELAADCRTENNVSINKDFFYQ